MPKARSEMQDNPWNAKRERKSMSSSPLNIKLPLTLEGAVVRLEPVRREHAELFWEIAKGDLEEIFR